MTTLANSAIAALRTTPAAPMLSVTGPMRTSLGLTLHTCGVDYLSIDPKGQVHLGRLDRPTHQDALSLFKGHQLPVNLLPHSAMQPCELPDYIESEPLSLKVFLLALQLTFPNAQDTQKEVRTALDQGHLGGQTAATPALRPESGWSLAEEILEQGIKMSLPAGRSLSAAFVPSQATVKYKRGLPIKRLRVTETRDRIREMLTAQLGDDHPQKLHAHQPLSTLGLDASAWTLVMADIHDHFGLETAFLLSERVTLLKGNLIDLGRAVHQAVFHDKP